MHSKTLNETINSLNSSIESGLSSSQVSTLQEQFGKNALKEKKKKTFLQKGVSRAL